METTYKDLLAQREALEQQIQEARKRETADALTKVRTLVVGFGLTAQEVFPLKPKLKGRKIEPKFRNPSTGETWTGRGKAPKWISDQDRAQFLIAS